MGTHPIFESDFDCLTEDILKWNRRLSSPILGTQETSQPLLRPWWASPPIPHRHVRIRAISVSVKSALIKQPVDTLACLRAKDAKDSSAETSRKTLDSFAFTIIIAMYT